MTHRTYPLLEYKYFLPNLDSTGRERKKKILGSGCKSLGTGQTAFLLLVH
jgi:hypothetical protein